MKSPLDTYLGWEQPRHHNDCARPVWDIGIRTEEGVVRSGGHMGEIVKHACTDEFCTHRGTFDQTVVRLVCKSCGMAQVISGEKTEDTGISDTGTKWLGYGLKPRQAVGLLLWPAEPWLSFGRGVSDEPYDFVVTRAKVKTVTEDTVVGQITQGRGKHNGLVWTALAVPDPAGRYGAGQRLKWVHANDGRGRGGTPLRTITGAARWIGARLDEQERASA
ncbi:hypothetical protein ACFUEN_29025 [Streptomyces griseorubiginosus]|uniref:hypothetical protein n=1 Tax=Streptomyces griseorubiginosus TaxID=67304 RepID=UPI00363D5201